MQFSVFQVFFFLETSIQVGLRPQEENKYCNQFEIHTKKENKTQLETKIVFKIIATLSYLCVSGGRPPKETQLFECNFK